MTRTLPTLIVVLLLSGPALAADRPAGGEGPPAGPRTSLRLAGGAVHQALADLDDGGEFSVDRISVSPGFDVFFSPDLQLSFSAEWSLSRYDFGGGGAFAAGEPFDDVDTLRFSGFVRAAIDDDWTFFGGPSVRFAAERGGSLSDGAVQGALAGATYRVDESFSIGPGLGFFTEIEDDSVVFPFVLVDWEFADRWSIRTGRGLGATRGPGLAVEWEFSDEWSLGLGGRWEEFRFRLDDDPVAPDGVGEERSIPVALVLSWRPARRSVVSLVAGVNFGGRVSLYDEDGDDIADEDYDPAPFFGIALSLSF